MTTMTHEKYNELQKKMDKLYSDFLDELTDIETEEDVSYMMLWVDNHISLVDLWARRNGADVETLLEIESDSVKLKEMLEC